MPSSQIAILGAGMAGMSACNVLAGLDCTVYEARSHFGGHASSFEFDGFIFDEGPHVSFTPHERVKTFLAQSVGGEYNEHPSYATNYYKGHWLKHPVQCNLRGLPGKVISDCIADFVRAQYEDNREIKNYRDWCYKGLGKTVSETFTRLYTRKYWNLELEDLTTDWVSARIYAPKLEEVLDGALAEAEGQHYYMSSFRYPKEGGFHSYNNLLAKRSNIRLNSRVTEIDLDKRRLSFTDGTSAEYEHLITSVPLPEIVKLIKDAPTALREAGEKLSCSSHYLISLGLNRPPNTDAYWIYFYDEDIPFSRVSFPYKYSLGTVPQDRSSLQVEVVHSKYKALESPQHVMDQTIEGLLRSGLLRSKDEIVACDARDIRYANVIFDFDRKANLAAVHEYLASKGVLWCGRFGDWEYLWTDQSILSGERAGNDVRKRLGLEPVQFDKAAQEAGA